MALCPDAVDVAEPAPGFHVCFSGRAAGARELAALHVHVKSELFGHFRVEAARAYSGDQPQSESQQTSGRGWQALGTHDQLPATTRETACANASQFCTSVSSRRRPCPVSS